MCPCTKTHSRRVPSTSDIQTSRLGVTMNLRLRVTVGCFSSRRPRQSPKAYPESAGTSAVHVSLSSDEIVKQQTDQINRFTPKRKPISRDALPSWLLSQPNHQVQMETRQRPPQGPRRRRRWPPYRPHCPKRSSKKIQKSRSFFKKCGNTGICAEQGACGCRGDRAAIEPFLHVLSLAPLSRCSVSKTRTHFPAIC